MPSQALPPQKMSSLGETRTTEPFGHYALATSVKRGAIGEYKGPTIFLMQSSMVGMLSPSNDGDNFWNRRESVQPGTRKPGKRVEEKAPHGKG